MAAPAAIFVAAMARARTEQMKRREKIIENAKRRIERLPAARVLVKKIAQGGILSQEDLMVLWEEEFESAARNAIHKKKKQGKKGRRDEGLYSILAQAVMECLGPIKSGVMHRISKYGTLDTSSLSRCNKVNLRQRVETVFGPLQPTNAERTAMAMKDSDLWMF